MTARTGQHWAIWLALAVGGGCKGGDEGEGEDGSGSGTGDPTEGEAAGPAGPMPLRRLNQDEFNNTIRDLLGDPSRPADGFTPDMQGESGFVTAPTVTEVPARDLMRVAESLALTAVADLDKLLPCDVVGDELGCVQQFVGEFGRRAFRRPLADDEVKELVDLYKQARGELALAVKDSLSVLLQAFLLSPRFLYRWELGPAAPELDDAGAALLNDHELASRLSYFLWASMPDAKLFAAADAGELRDPEQLEAQARRMLADPRARDAVLSFHTQWLGLANFRNMEMDGSQFPQFTVEQVKGSMLGQLSRLVDSVVFGGEGGLDVLLNADFVYADDVLGKAIYFKYEQGAELTRMQLDPAQPRAGILSLPIFLASHSFFRATSPVKRGKVIRERLLCDVLPPPPPNANTVPPMADPNSTTRGLYDLILDNPDCTGCHALMNPLGYAFEHLDYLGRWRPTEFTHPIDASGSIIGVEGEPAFENAAELGGLLSGLPEVQQCYGTQWLRFALQRKEVKADGDTLAQIHRTFEDAGHDIQELIVAVAVSPAFRTRALAEGEVSP